jgi:hypothetical protein
MRRPTRNGYSSGVENFTEDGVQLIPSSHLRVYQPLEAFPSSERRRWAEYIESGIQVPEETHYIQVRFEGHPLGILHPSTDEHAFHKKVDGEYFVCPTRTRLRVLAGLLAVRGGLPGEVADAFVPEEAAAKAAQSLDELREGDSDLRAYITSATWQVPLRWFVAFTDEERMVTSESRVRLRTGVRYETRLGVAVERVHRGVNILKEVGMAEEIIQPVEDLWSWLSSFSEQCLLELDYGTVGDLFREDDLVEDHSAAEVWECLEALEIGEMERAGETYARLAGWWGQVQARQTAN